MPCKAAQDGWIMVESSDKTYATWEAPCYSNGPQQITEVCLYLSFSEVPSHIDARLCDVSYFDQLGH